MNRHEPGPPRDLTNMREEGVRSLAVDCLNHACRHHTVISADEYPGDLEAFICASPEVQ